MEEIITDFSQRPSLLSPLKQRSILYLTRFLRWMPKTARVIQLGAHQLQGRFSLGVIGVLIDQEDRILLVEHVFHPQVPWGLPGGWVNRNEAPAVALAREFQEETGLKVHTIVPLDIWTNQFLKNHVNLAFMVEALEPLDGDAISLSSELLAYQWVTRDQMPRILPDHKRVIDIALAFRQQNVVEK